MDEEDFGDVVTVNSSIPLFHSPLFDWDNFNGPNQQLLGYSKVEKKHLF
jgi:hypothetical protein